MCFKNDHEFYLAQNDFSVKLFDIRKSIQIPVSNLRENCTTVFAMDDFLVIGMKNGFLKIFEKEKLQKTL